MNTGLDNWQPRSGRRQSRERNLSAEAQADQCQAI